MFASYLDECSCDEEEEYQLISEGDEESEESTEDPKQERAYNSPTVPEVRSRDLSLSISINMTSTNAVNSGQGSPTSPNFLPTIQLVNITSINPMPRTNIKLPILNGNGL